MAPVPGPPLPDPPDAASVTMRAPAARPRRTAGEATRRRLLDAGRAGFARDGFAGASVQSLVDDAGVAAPALYHHFASKSGLFLAVAEEVYGEVVSTLAAATGTAASFVEAVDRMIAAAGRLHAAEPSLAPMALTVQLEVRRNPDLRRELAPTLGTFRDFVGSVAALAPPELRTRVDEHGLRLALTTLLNGLSSVAVTVRDPAAFVAAADALRAIVVPTAA